MRWMALCVTVAFGLLGCERSTEADSGAKPGGGAEVKPAPKASKEPIRSLPQVDTSALDDFSEGIWIDMVNELLSPCGEPVSVARCIAESRKCNKCVPAARYVARLVDDGYSRDEIRDIFRVRYGDETKVEGLTAHDSPLRGSPMAPVTLYEFSEAQKQGKFWEMHDLLVEHQDDLQRSNFDDYAKKIGLDLGRFKADMASKETEKKIDADIAEGKKAGVDSTPSIYVNDRQFIFAPDELGDYVREELEQ
jgi:hypothetical protein